MTQILVEERELLQLAADAFESLEVALIANALREDQTKETLIQRLSVAERQAHPLNVWALIVRVKAALQGKKPLQDARAACLRVLGLL